VQSWAPIDSATPPHVAAAFLGIPDAHAGIPIARAADLKVATSHLQHQAHIPALLPIRYQKPTQAAGRRLGGSCVPRLAPRLTLPRGQPARAADLTSGLGSGSLREFERGMSNDVPLKTRGKPERDAGGRLVMLACRTELAAHGALQLRACWVGGIVSICSCCTSSRWSGRCSTGQPPPPGANSNICAASRTEPPQAAGPCG
jgi:hypothetical protein